MIKIELDEKSVFYYDADNLSVNIWDHADGRYTGSITHAGFIKFFDMDQLYQFKEMLDFIIEKDRKGN